MFIVCRFPPLQQIVEDDDSDEPWKAHCQRHFENRVPNKGETWRDLYYRCEKEREHKIEKIAKRIKKHEKKAIPVRQARVVEQQLPVGNGRAIASSTVITKTIKNHLPNKSSQSSSGSLAGNSRTTTSTVVVKREANAANGSKFKPKAAPLMQKSMALFKSRFRR